MEELAFKILTAVIEDALPIAVILETGNLLISMVLRAAFGGRLWFGR